jgi:hypothetical protein
MIQVDENTILNGVQPHDFSDAIEESIKLGGISHIDELIPHFSIFCFKRDAEKDFPSSVFETIVKQMKRSELQILPDSSKLLHILHHEWGRLTDSQKNVLLRVIDDTFPLYEDKLSYFILAEILGEYFASDEALKVIKRLLVTDNETVKAFLTYGLGKMAQHTVSVETKKSALLELNKLKEDLSESVRAEAQTALRKNSAI